MKLKADLTVKVEPENILAMRHMGASGGLDLFIAEDVRRRCDRRVPMRTGRLRASASVSDDGSRITYGVKYAKYQYYGVSDSGRALSYSGAPMRGGFWERRMLADEGDALAEDVAVFIGGRRK